MCLLFPFHQFYVNFRVRSVIGVGFVSADSSLMILYGFMFALCRIIQYWVSNCKVCHCWRIQCFIRRELIVCNFLHRCMWPDWSVLYSRSHHLIAFLTLAVLISNIPSGRNSFFSVWIFYFFLFFIRFEFFHYRCILSLCFRYTKDSN